MEKIAILLATYNGEHYIKEQIDSILNQTNKNFDLYIRDDNSVDKTKEIIKEYMKLHKNIFLIENYNFIENHGASNNFLNLISFLKTKQSYKYYMFSDQDDVWNENKIEKTLKEMKNTERVNGDIPILVHTDLMVVNQKLEILDDSFFNYRCLNSSINKINRLIIQNNVTGCTMMINRLLFDKIPVNKNTIKIAMHDWWITLIACSFGKISFLNESTIKYRQHEKNVVGATKVKSFKFIFNRLFKKNYVKETLNKAIIQAEEFYNVYNKELKTEDKEIILKFISLKSEKKIKKIYIIFKYNYFKQGLIQKIGQILFI